MGPVAVAARMPALCIPHGGGPLPLLGDEAHKPLVNWLTRAAQDFPKPKAIVTISAHWEVIQGCHDLADHSRPLQAVL